jgi:hypothetical protein
MKCCTICISINIEQGYSIHNYFKKLLAGNFLMEVDLEEETGSSKNVKTESIINSNFNVSLINNI